MIKLFNLCLFLYIALAVTAIGFWTISDASDRIESTKCAVEWLK